MTVAVILALIMFGIAASAKDFQGAGPAPFPFAIRTVQGTMGDWSGFPAAAEAATGPRPPAWGLGASFTTDITKFPLIPANADPAKMQGIVAKITGFRWYAPEGDYRYRMVIVHPSAPAEAAEVGLVASRVRELVAMGAFAPAGAVPATLPASQPAVTGDEETPEPANLSAHARRVYRALLQVWPIIVAGRASQPTMRWALKASYYLDGAASIARDEEAQEQLERMADLIRDRLERRGLSGDEDHYQTIAMIGAAAQLPEHGRTARCHPPGGFWRWLGRIAGKVGAVIFKTVANYYTGGQAGKLGLNKVVDDVAKHTQSLGDRQFRDFINASDNVAVAAWGLGELRKALAKRIEKYPKQSKKAQDLLLNPMTLPELQAAYALAMNEDASAETMRLTFRYFFPTFKDCKSLHVLQAIAALLYGGKGVIPTLNAGLKQRPRGADGKKLPVPEWIKQIEGGLASYALAQKPAGAGWKGWSW